MDNLGSSNRQKVAKSARIGAFVILGVMLCYGAVTADPNPRTFEDMWLKPIIFLQYIFKALIFGVFPLLAMLGVIFDIIVSRKVSLLEPRGFWDSFFLIIYGVGMHSMYLTIVPLAYYCFISLFRLIDSSTTLLDNVLLSHSWKSVITHICIFHGVFFALLLHIVVIAFLKGNYKVNVGRCLLARIQRRLGENNSNSETDVVVFNTEEAPISNSR